MEPTNHQHVENETLCEIFPLDSIELSMTNKERADSNTIKLKPLHFAAIQTFIAIVVGISSFFFSGASKITSFVVAVENRYATKEMLQSEATQRKTDTTRIEQMIRDQSAKIDSIYNILLTTGANRSTGSSKGNR